MRAAPPVQALSCSAGPWRWIQVTLYASSAAVAAGWSAARLWQPGAGSLGVGKAFGLGAAIAAWLGLAPRRAQLVWDGNAWKMRRERAAACAGQPRLMLDLGSWMLVRFDPEGVPASSAVWLPLSRSDAVASWPALRVALHAPQPAQPVA